jgi:chorismate mutase/prephenate dehydratase
MTLEEIRAEIDRIDAQLLPLFLRRMDCAAQVAAVKKEKGLPVFNERRERQILDGVAEKAGAYGGEARILYSNMMTMSRAVQHRLLGAGKELREAVRSASAEPPRAEHVACLGRSGSFSHEALLRLYPQAQPLFFADFPAIFEAVACGAADLGVLPVENSSAGSVGEVYDLILKYRFSILGALSLPVRHCLASSESDPDKIRTVFSHPQALRQCSAFLQTHGWKTEPCSSTAGAAETAKGSGIGAVCSRRAAEACGLHILAENIQNVTGNRTRFIVIGRKMYLPPDADKISVCFALPHRTGTLYGVLARFAAAGLNLTKIESRPIPGKNFEYDFYLDFTGNVHDEHTLDLLCALYDELPRFTFLGNYRETF